MHSVSIVGCGYTGLRLAHRWLSLNCRIRGFASRDESLARIAAVGAESIRLNLDAAVARVELAGKLVYYMVPPPPRGVRDSRLENLLPHIDGKPLRVVYLSTTGVYGDQAGARVDEDTLPAPMTERALRRLAAENALRTWADSVSVSWSILRVPGIYGPGRLPLDRLRRGDPAIEPREATPSNRIHVEDLVTACMAAGVVERADRRIYNVTDGSDDSLTAYLQRVARIGQLPPPPLVSRAVAEQTFSAVSWSFLSESRRVDSRRMRDELGVALAFEDLDAGIRASL